MLLYTNPEKEHQKITLLKDIFARVSQDTSVKTYKNFMI